MTAGLQAAIVAQQRRTITKADVDRMKENGPTKAGLEIQGVLDKLEKIEAKEKCLRVQFLDWLSDKLLDWSNRVHVMSSKIDSPCLIEVAPRKKEESRHFKESKEIERLKQLLKEEREKNKL
jgi:hypothetical protein